MCVLLKDNEILSFGEHDKLQEYLDFRTKNDRWMISQVKKMTVFAGTGTPSEFKAKTDSAITEEAIADCMMNGTNLFLRFYVDINGKEKKGVIPLRYTAIRSLLERAKIGGFSITNEFPDAGIEVMPLNMKADIINMCLQLYTAQAKVLYRDEKISAVMSGQYAVLGEKEITDAVENSLKDDFPNAEFLRGRVSHEHFQLEYMLHADEIEEDILMTLNDNGIGVDKVQAMLGVFTSDIGSAAATVYSYLDVDGQKIYFGKPLAVKHIGKKTAEDVKKAVDKLYSMFESNPADLKALTETKINNPGGCLRLIAKEFKLPKKFALEVADELEARNPSECTAYEIFWYLNQIVARFETVKKDMFRVMNLQETVAETLKINYKRFDKPFEWARKESVDE